MATYIVGAQHTANILSAERRVDVPNELIWLRPNLAPVVKLAMGRGMSKSNQNRPIRKEATINPEFNVFEKQPHAQWTAINDASNYTAGDTALTLDDVSFIKAGMVLVDSTTDEQLYVSAVNYSTKVVTVTRAFGQTSAAAISDNDMIYVLGQTSEENSSLPGSLTIQNRKRVNYCEIFRWPITISGTLLASGLYTGPKRQELRREAYYEGMAEKERKYIFGEPYEDTSGGANSYPIRKTGGIKYWCETGGGQVSNAGGAFTKAEFQTHRRNSSEYMEDDQIALCGALMVDGFSTWKDGKLEVRPSEEVYNINVAEWVDGFGRIFIIHHKELKDGSYGSTGGWGGLAFFLEKRQLKERFLSGNGYNRTMAFYENVLKTGVDGVTDEWMGEEGLEVRLPEKMSEVYGITSVTE